jgi:single-stranded-DNA-specific exonuclease
VATVRRCAQRGYFAKPAEPDLFACSIWSRWARWPMSRAARPEPRAGGAGAQGHGPARQHRHGRADRRQPAEPRADLCSDLGFALGPRINAGGRVGESTLGVRLLTTEDPDEARAIARSFPPE